MGFSTPAAQTVTIAGTVGIAGGVDVTGSSIDVNGTDVGAPGAGPSVAIRNVSAASSASAALGPISGNGFAGPGGTSASATVIAAPGAGKKLELHTLSMEVVMTQWKVLTAGNEGITATLTLLDLTTNLPLASTEATVTGSGAGTGTVDPTSALDFDFLGVTLPANHGIKAVLAITWGNHTNYALTAIGNLNALTYNVIT
jgi:hypothetical protein